MSSLWRWHPKSFSALKGAATSDNAVADRDGATEGGPATDDAFEWAESRYDTRVALEREVIDRPPKRGKSSIMRTFRLRDVRQRQG